MKKRTKSHVQNESLNEEYDSNLNDRRVVDGFIKYVEEAIRTKKVEGKYVKNIKNEIKGLKRLSLEDQLNYLSANMHNYWYLFMVDGIPNYMMNQYCESRGLTSPTIKNNEDGNEEKPEIVEAYPFSLFNFNKNSRIELKMIPKQNLCIYISNTILFSNNLVSHMQDYCERASSSLESNEKNEISKDKDKDLFENIHVHFGTSHDVCDRVIVSIACTHMSACQPFKLHYESSNGCYYINEDDTSLIKKELGLSEGLYNMKFIETTNFYVGELQKE